MKIVNVGDIIQFPIWHERPLSFRVNYKILNIDNGLWDLLRLDTKEEYTFSEIKIIAEGYCHSLDKTAGNYIKLQERFVMRPEVILSIHKKWLDLIFSHKKVIECRQTFPTKFKLEFAKINLIKDASPYSRRIIDDNPFGSYPIAYLYETKNGGGRGKIVGYAAIRDCIDIQNRDLERHCNNYCEEMACLEYGEIFDYNVGWFIENVIKLSDEVIEKFGDINHLGLKKAPQSWCYVKKGKQK